MWLQKSKPPWSLKNITESEEIIPVMTVGVWQTIRYRKQLNSVSKMESQITLSKKQEDNLHEF